jgi:hypothetical protein
MTWIRFGRNEPGAPVLPLLGAAGHTIDLRARAQDSVLLLWFAPPSGLQGCSALLAGLASSADDEPEAEAVAVTPIRADLADPHSGVTVAYDESGALRDRYAALMEVDSDGQGLLFVLDRDSSPVYAWVGGCELAPELRAGLAMRLRSAAFLCPECSVPDPASSAGWGVIY